LAGLPLASDRFFVLRHGVRAGVQDSALVFFLPAGLRLYSLRFEPAGGVRFGPDDSDSQCEAGGRRAAHLRQASPVVARLVGEEQGAGAVGVGGELGLEMRWLTRAADY
jgi:hypothetical protein